MKIKLWKFLSIAPVTIVALSASCSSKKTKEENYLNELIKNSEITANKLKLFTTAQNNSSQQNLKALTSLEQDIISTKTLLAKKDHTNAEIISATEKLLLTTKTAQQNLEIETLITNLTTFKTVFKASREQNAELREKYDEYITKIDSVISNRNLVELKNLDKEIKELALV
ncbi:hypothetical protein EG856_02475 [Mycoplasmopsis phocirhinis]|uniref:Lipoprotein n=1 Tax=Mycoplasmopsis phocirhinis TaxID=142650 RepID=A0A4P6MSD9_9BACT|nr:hypothetical protein [Mycoplasmopsis phocirhinis]QBF34771.1 hypothetical protein EG856_02475 [Mycoplasmopsis phocirhinis]